MQKRITPYTNIQQLFNFLISVSDFYKNNFTWFPPPLNTLIFSPYPVDPFGQKCIHQCIH